MPCFQVNFSLSILCWSGISFMQSCAVQLDHGEGAGGTPGASRDATSLMRKEAAGTKHSSQATNLDEFNYAGVREIARIGGASSAKVSADGGGNAFPSDDNHGSSSESLSSLGVEPHEARQKKRAPAGEAAYPKLFCFMVTQRSGYEFDLVQHQAEIQAGIFSCDRSVVFSGEDVRVSEKSNIMAVPLTHIRSGITGRPMLNIDAFVEAWDKIIGMNDISTYDYLVKVDPDTIFFPMRLKMRLASIVKEGDADAGVFVKNCNDRNIEMYGSIEVISRQALQSLSRRSGPCDSMDHGHFSEDMWLWRCLKALGVKGVDGTALVFNKRCRPSRRFGPDAVGLVALHPYKTLAEWEKGYAAASAPTPAR